MVHTCKKRFCGNSSVTKIFARVYETANAVCRVILGSGVAHDLKDAWTPPSWS